MKISRTAWGILCQIRDLSMERALSEEEPAVQELIEAGYITEESLALWEDRDEEILTEKGRKAADLVIKQMQPYVKGLPYSKRTDTNPEAAVKRWGDTPWLTGFLPKTPNATKQGYRYFISPDRGFLMFGDPPDGVVHLPAESSEIFPSKSFPNDRLRDLLNYGNTQDLKPYKYKIPRIDLPELIELKSKHGDLRIAVQKMYWDIITSRLKALDFRISTDRAQSPVYFFLRSGRSLGPKRLAAMISRFSVK